MTDNIAKKAQTDHPIHELLAVRYSPYAFDPTPVETTKLLSCLEAARWAASSFNEQPWSFIVAGREQPEAFERHLSCLVEANQPWAGRAGVLILTVVCKSFSRNDKPNRVAGHDLGLAVANLAVEATARGLSIHQMAGINLAHARQTYNIPETHDPFTMIALGYAADAAMIADKQLAERDRAPRGRKPLSQFVFADAWGTTASLVGKSG